MLCSVTTATSASYGTMVSGSISVDPTTIRTCASGGRNSQDACSPRYVHTKYEHVQSANPPSAVDLPLLSVVSPVYREGETIERFHAALKAALLPLFNRYR